VAIIAGALLVASSTLREYSAAREIVLENALASVHALPALAPAIQDGNEPAVQAALEELTGFNDALRYGFARTAQGDVLGAWHTPAFSRQVAAPLSVLRDTASVTDVAVSERASQIRPEGQELLASLCGGEEIWDITVPVYATHGVDGLLVVGYVQLGVSRTLTIASIMPAVATSAAIAGGFIVLCTLFSFYMTRRITTPFSTIVRMADDISAGRAVKEQGLENSGEFKDIVMLLNNIIGGLNTQKTKMEVDHQLLSMKVEERTSQLSRRNEELNKAVQEVTQTKNALRQLAYYDSLTNLPNRRLFTEQLRLLLKMAKRNDELLGLLFLDLDNFKRINDSLGHVAGDLLLREVAKRLSQCVRASDVIGHYQHGDSSEIDVSRLGGDEFTVVLNRLDSIESAGAVAQRLLDVLVQPMTIQGHELVVTPSIGIAVAPRDAEDVEKLLKAADTAMYHAKGTGKNNFVFYDPKMDEASVERLTLENDLRKAIERNELVLHYQPQVDTTTGSIVGAEALMRWQHPEHGLVPPFKFIPLAEEMGLIGEMGEWGLREACRQMVALQAKGLELPKVSVNVSALQFNHEFIRRVGQVLKETGMHPKRLELELTEGIMMEGSESVVRSLEELRELGVQLSVDDFGTGYSSLSYLSRFPLDELKIDRSFVIEFDKSAGDAGLVMAIIAMAKSLGLNLVAEGVETHDQYRFLRQHGAGIIQGYLFSKPVPIDDMIPMLSPGFFRPQISDIGSDAGGSNAA
jgi:diguanylate cyclase (GGDEF)-like protein